jgi:hypothetical protein
VVGPFLSLLSPFAPVAIHPLSVTRGLFRSRPSTSVRSNVQSILYPQSYCPLDRSRIHSVFNQEVCLDRFRTPHYSTLPNAAPADRPLDNGRGGWRDQHRIPRRQFSRRLLTLPNEITLAGPVRVRCLGRVQRTEPRDEGAIGVVAAIERYEFLRGDDDSK